MKENKLINEAISQLRESLGNSLSFPIKVKTPVVNLAARKKMKTIQAANPPERSFSFKVAGVTYENRQLLIAGLTKSSPISLKRDPHNPYDSNAIEVIIRGGRSIGFVPKNIALNIAPLLDSGMIATVRIGEITGGVPNYSYGVMVTGVIK